MTLLHFWPYREYGSQVMVSASNRDTKGKDKKQKPGGIYVWKSSMAQDCR